MAQRDARAAAGPGHVCHSSHIYFRQPNTRTRPMRVRSFPQILICVACLVVSPGAHNPTNRNFTQADDSQRILFQTDRDGNWEVYSMRIDGSRQTNLSRNQADDQQPSLSPDGKRIVFISNRDGNNEIYVMAADSSNVRRLTNDPADDVYPAWLPDGHISFASNRNGTDEIYIMNADGT